jgi:hypothetical protein
MPDWQDRRIKFPSGVVWDGPSGTWQGVRCAPVEFTGKSGSGVTQAARLTPDGRNIYPVVSCNRDEAIEAVVDELRTAEDGLAEIDPGTGKLRTVPQFRLPIGGQDEPEIIDTYRKHLLSGSRKERDAAGKEEHYLDNIPNHLLLATAYARLAETFAGIAGTREPFAFESVHAHAPGSDVGLRHLPLPGGVIL